MDTSNSPLSPAASEASGWNFARRSLMAGAAVLTLIAVFYTVENWRGKRAWENCRRQREANGEVLDWTTYIPVAVPDDQNFYKVPKMQDWFVKQSSTNFASGPANGPRAFLPPPHKESSLVLAEVKVLTVNAEPGAQGYDAVLRFDAPDAREQAAKLLRDALGPCAMGSQQCALLARPLDQFKPLHLALQADTVPTTTALAAFLPRNPFPNLPAVSPEVSYLTTESVGSDAFRISLKAPVYGAADYLAWTEPLTPDFDLVRKALERPYARIDCDYQQPYAIGIPNFIALRQASQILSQRAQACLLLGQPEAAWHELALIHDLSQILEAKPPHRPVTLVGAMINVAVAGLYCNIVQDGLRLQAWRQPQLLAIERQLQDSDLLAGVVKALKEEAAADCRTFEITPRRELVKLFSFSPSVSAFAVTWMPRGWFYQNMVVGTELSQQWLGCVDITNRLVPARRISETVRQASLNFGHGWPYSFLVMVALPNFSKALQTTALNQTRVNEAALACALERCRLAQGQYPETLDALAPQFVENLPHDLMGGQPLKYRRTATGDYLLYSVGWNETDDSGAPGKTLEEGDWVWQVR